MLTACVIMPVYNGEKFLSDAIESVLGQSFEDFSFIIIDDGSTDRCVDIICSYRDSRIQYIRLPSHRGISHALNCGLQCAEEDMVFRMDADDVCSPHRLQRQVQFLQEHPEVSICGSNTELIDEKGRTIGFRETKKGDQSIKIALFFGETSLAHPAVAIRKDFLEKHHLRYSESSLYAEDYELWCRCSTFCIFDNIPEALVKYRRHSNSVSKFHRIQQRISARRILANHLRNLGIRPSPEELNCHMQFALPLDNDIQPDRLKMIAWRDKLLEWNSREQVFDHGLFQVELTERLQLIFR